MFHDPRCICNNIIIGQVTFFFFVGFNKSFQFLPFILNIIVMLSEECRRIFPVCFESRKNGIYRTVFTLYIISIPDTRHFRNVIKNFFTHSLFHSFAHDAMRFSFCCSCIQSVDHSCYRMQSTYIRHFILIKLIAKSSFKFRSRFLGISNYHHFFSRFPICCHTQYLSY